MRLRLRIIYLVPSLTALLLLAWVHLRGHQVIHQMWHKMNIDTVVPSVPDPRCPERRSGYCVISNYQTAQAIVGYDESITLTTQGTINYLNHLVEVCVRWQGPISVTVYAPGREFPLAKMVIEMLRSQHDCIRKWTSWHLIFNVAHMPNSQEMLSFVTANNSVQTSSSYIKMHRLAYPINVARNVARIYARTRYIFASDIELYPSIEIIPRFLNLVRSLKFQDPDDFAEKRQVFVLPVFEVTNTSKAPQTKSELIKLFHKHQAFSFHKFTCNVCHRIPKLQKWLRRKIRNSEMLNIFLTTKRDRKSKLKDWEPFFIGTNKEPFYDERLTWNGKNNKMQVSYEMCLQDYDFHILDEAFLTHSPGIKRFNAIQLAYRAPYMLRNAGFYITILKELRAQYGDKEQC